MVYVARKHVVAQCLARLRGRRTHSLFAGYLHLRQRAAELGRETDLQPEFLSFYRTYFRVEGHPLGTPYVKPFTEQRPSAANLWLNENVAGSYAPSSLRPNQPFRQVVQIEGRNYSLRPHHAALAREHLLYSGPVRAMELAVFMYRDFGFLDHHYSPREALGAFAYEFGYAEAPGASPSPEFALVFDAGDSDAVPADWLEPL